MDKTWIISLYFDDATAYALVDKTFPAGSGPRAYINVTDASRRRLTHFAAKGTAIPYPDGWTSYIGLNFNRTAQGGH